MTSNIGTYVIYYVLFVSYWSFLFQFFPCFPQLLVYSRVMHILHIICICNILAIYVSNASFLVLQRSRVSSKVLIPFSSLAYNPVNEIIVMRICHHYIHVTVGKVFDLVQFKPVKIIIVNVMWMSSDIWFQMPHVLVHHIVENTNIIDFSIMAIQVNQSSGKKLVVCIWTLYVVECLQCFLCIFVKCSFWNFQSNAMPLSSCFFRKSKTMQYR